MVQAKLEATQREVHQLQLEKNILAEKDDRNEKGLVEVGLVRQRQVSRPLVCA